MPKQTIMCENDCKQTYTNHYKTLMLFQFRTNKFQSSALRRHLQQHHENPINDKKPANTNIIPFNTFPPLFNVITPAAKNN